LIDSTDIKKLARECGFDLCGIADVKAIPEAERRYRAWLEQGFQADMAWMSKHADRRADASRLADGLKSVIMLGVNYYQPNSEAVPARHGRVSRYARGRDYHKVIEGMTRKLIGKVEIRIDSDAIQQQRPIFKSWVDYGPLLERPYAVKAGLGYIGKSGLLINRHFGTWFFLAEIVTSLELEPDRIWSGEHGRCGTCRRCIDGCPTGAITEDRTIDARRCLSYLTIEHRGEISKDLARAMGDQVFGCDICQEVCPHNHKRQKPTDQKELTAAAGVGEFVDCEQTLEMIDDEQAFLDLTAGTALTRPKREGLTRNARVVMENESLKKSDDR